jgi:hypothetical protein
MGKSNLLLITSGLHAGPLKREQARERIPVVDAALFRRRRTGPLLLADFS